MDARYDDSGSLGLIGGSMAKALNQLDDVIVYGRDLDDEVVNRAKLLNIEDRKSVV